MGGAPLPEGIVLKGICGHVDYKRNRLGIKGETLWNNSFFNEQAYSNELKKAGLDHKNLTVATPMLSPGKRICFITMDLIVFYRGYEYASGSAGQ